MEVWDGEHPPASLSSVEFAVGDSEFARLEAVPSTASVYVPFRRGAGAPAGAYSFSLRVTWPDRTSEVLDATMAAGASNAEVCVKTVGKWRDGKSFALDLLDSRGDSQESRSIACVPDVGNSVKFPAFLGETVRFGEWTMDLDAATNLVAAATGKAYTLLVFGGALWCPNCTNMETWVYDTQDFRRWAKNNKVALVTYDQPQNGTTAATLLTHDVGSNGKSGSYYLSRKGLTAAQGMEQFNRVYDLSHTRGWPQGLLVEPAAQRVANPVLILLRKDGTPCGRFSAQRVQTGGSTSTEPYGLAENIARLNEFLKMADDADAHGLTEEDNNKAGTTPLTCRPGEAATFKLQASDRADVYRLEGIEAGVLYRFRAFVNTGKAREVTLGVSVLSVDAAGVTQTTPVVPVAAGIWSFTDAQLQAGLVLEVSAFSDFRYANYGGSTTFGGKIELEKVPPDWGGALTLSVDPTTVIEGVDRYAVVSVTRSLAGYGAVQGRVAVDSEASTAHPARYCWAKEGEQSFSFGNGDFGKAQKFKVLINDDEIADGDGEVVFRLEGLTGKIDASDVVDSCRLLIREDDRLATGWLRIAGSEPTVWSDGCVYAPAGDVVAFAVRRVGGSSGTVGCAVVASDGAVAVSPRQLTWTDGNGNLDRESVQYVTVTLPRSAAGDVLVSLVPDGETAVDGTAKDLLVRVLPADTPRFAKPTVKAGALQQGEVSVSIEVLGDVPSGEVQVECAASSIPGEVTATYVPETQTVEITGKASAAGEYADAFRLKIVDDKGVETYSTPVEVKVEVKKLEEASETFATYRRWLNLPVVDTDGALVGVLDLSLPSSGKGSAKFRGLGRVVKSFVVEGWKTTDGGVSAVAASGDYLLAVQDSEHSGLSVELTLPDGRALPVRTFAGDVWNGDDVTADAWGGLYTVAFPADEDRADRGEVLCTGTPVLSLRMDTGRARAYGTFSYAGYLPNGKAFSGSAGALVGLAGDDDGQVRVPVFYTASGEDFSSLLRIVPNGAGRASETRQMVWSERGACARWQHADSPSASYARDYLAYGSWYDPAENWQTRMKADYDGKTTLPFSAEGMAQVSTVVASAAGLASGSPNGLSLTLSFAASSGAVGGTIRDQGQTEYSFFGMVMPGWSAGCGDCGLDPTTSVVIPFVCGAYSIKRDGVSVGGKITVEEAGSTTASYNLHAVDYAANAQNWGCLTAVPQPADVTPFQWRITSGTSGSEPWYAVGDVIPLSAGPVGVTGSAVDGYGTYSLDYGVAEMGSVGFAETMVSATSLSEAVELTVRRKATHADDRVRVRWGTCEGTALNGTDYFAASGEIEWAPGDSADKTIRVPLCLRADAAASRQFRVRLAPVPETDLKPDEHIPVVVDDIATVMISAGGMPGKTGTVACSSQTKWWGSNVLSTDAAGKKTVKVYPGDVAAIRVARTGGTSGKIGVCAVTTSGSAMLGRDFFGESQTTLYWADGHAEEKLVYFGTSASADGKSFTVRLTPVDATGNSIPGAVISTVTVQITKQGTTCAEAEAETISDAIASTFVGILRADDFPESGRGGFVYYEGSPLQGSGGLYIDGSKCSVSDGSYQTDPAGRIFTLTQTWTETICGESKTQTLKLVVDNGSIGNLSNAMYEYGTAEATLWCADQNGLPVQRHFSGGIFRVDSNMSNLLAYQGALSPFVGSYTIGLGGDGLTSRGEPGGNGFLTLGLAADGGVTLTGRAGDGTELGLFDSVTNRAQVLVDYTDVASAEVRIPVYNVTSAYALGGVIRLVLENGVPVVKWENESDCVFYECLAEGKTSDDAHYSRSFVPHGGLWESAGKAFLLGGKKTFALVGDAQDRFDENLDWTIADSGRVSGTLGGVAYEGVMLMNMSAASRQELGGAAAVGYLNAPAGTGWTATESLLLKTEPMPTVPENWKFPTEVSFNGNGNDTGAPPLPMTAPSGSPILLPKQSDGRDGFGKEGKVLVAWSDAAGQEHKAGSAYLVPALPVTLSAVWGEPPAGVELRLSYDGELFPAGILVSNLTQNAEVEGNPFLAQPGDVLQFTLASTDTMPVYSAAFGGEPLTAGAYGVFSMTVGATGGDVTFGSTDASGVPDDPVAQRQAREALVESVTVPAPGKTLEETKVAVGGQVDAILADQPGVRPSEVAAWIQAGGFTGAQVATAREIALSYGLGADSLFTEDPVGEVSAFEPSGSQPDAGVAYDLVFSVRDGEAGEAVTVAATARAKSFAEKLVKATSDLSDWSGSSAIAAQVEAAYDAATKSVRVRVALPAGLSGAFLKIAR